MLATISLGQPYPTTPPGGWPDGMAVLDWSATRPLALLVALSLPTAAEIEAARRGTVRLGVRAPRPGEPAALLYEIPGLADGDAPYEVERLAPDQRPDLAELPTQESRYLVTILLLSAETGTVRAIRQVSLSPRASAAWRAAVAGESSGPSGDVPLGRAGV